MQILTFPRGVDECLYAVEGHTEIHVDVRWLGRTIEATFFAIDDVGALWTASHAFEFTDRAPVVLRLAGHVVHLAYDGVLDAVIGEVSPMPMGAPLPSPAPRRQRLLDRLRATAPLHAR